MRMPVRMLPRREFVLPIVVLREVIGALAERMVRVVRRAGVGSGERCAGALVRVAVGLLGGELFDVTRYDQGAI